MTHIHPYVNQEVEIKIEGLDGIQPRTRDVVYL